MRSKLSIIGLFTLLAIGFANKAEAQFWKNWFRKKHKTEEKVPVMPKPRPLRRKLEVPYPKSIVKERYRVDVLAPIYVNDLQKSGRRIPWKSITGTEFYEGVELAIDTLNSYHYNIDVYMHDVGDPATSTVNLIRNHVLDSTDLLIGAVPYQDVYMLAAFAKKHQINFISAFSPSDGDVKDNPYFVMLQPTLEVHCSFLDNRVAKRYPKKNIVLFYRNSVDVDKEAFSCVERDSDQVHFTKVLCNALPTKQHLTKLFDSTRTNVIVISILDVGYAQVLLKQLYTLFPNYKFDVYGMPSWKNMSVLRKADAFPNVSVFVTSPFYYDINTPMSKSLLRNFKKEFGGYPGELVFRGYETMYWFSYLLTRYGTIFNPKFSDNSPAPFTHFEIRPKWNNVADFLYNENQHLYLYRYQKGHYSIEQ